jgi:glutamate 5-kinase
MINLNSGDSIVLKIGTEALRYKGENKVDRNVIRCLCNKTAELYGQGYKPKIVTSGAVFKGMEIKGINERPDEIIERQFLSGLGQRELMDMYANEFLKKGFKPYQLVLTHENLEKEENRNSIIKIMDMCYAENENTIPVINENDPVSDEEFKKKMQDEEFREKINNEDYYFDDNDTLSYLIAKYSNSRIDIMFNPNGGLYDYDNELIKTICFEEQDSIIEMVKGRDKSPLGRGGITTKVETCFRCSENNIYGIIANSNLITDKNISFSEMLENTSQYDMTVFIPKITKQI